MATTPANFTEELRTERRIAWLILFFGALFGLVAAFRYSMAWSAGLMIGSILAWFNFRWLRQGMDALVAAAEAQSGAPRPHVPMGAYFRPIFRHALIAFTVYVIFKALKGPLASMVLGLCALGPAAAAASVYEIAHRER
jgi:hypothetical protein